MGSFSLKAYFGLLTSWTKSFMYVWVFVNLPESFYLKLLARMVEDILVLDRLSHAYSLSHKLNLSMFQHSEIAKLFYRWQSQKILLSMFRHQLKIYLAN
jgi:hypothetical protein